MVIYNPFDILITTIVDHSYIQKLDCCNKQLKHKKSTKTSESVPVNIIFLTAYMILTDIDFFSRAGTSTNLFGITFLLHPSGFWRANAPTRLRAACWYGQYY